MEDKTNNLKHLKVDGFKSIAKLDLAMENINLLIGANGAGKSNFISLFTFLSALSQGKLKQYVETEGGAERFFHFGAKRTPEIVLDLKVDLNSYHVEFTPNVDDDSLVFAEEYCTDIPGRKWPLESRKGESGLTKENLNRRMVKEDLTKGTDGKYSTEFNLAFFSKYNLSQLRVYHFHDTSSQALFKNPHRLDSSQCLEKDAANIAPFLYHLRESKEENYRKAYWQIVDAVRTVAPFFHDFHLEPTGVEGEQYVRLRWTHAQHDAPFSANVLSDGTARFICLATLFLQPKELRPSTIILDEPELGLHPAALGVLADMIRVTSKQTQVICATQSVTFANFFAPEDFIVVDAKEGVSEFRRPEKEPLAGWLEEYGMGDIWAKNLIGGRPAW